jgi:hypothetical protein
MKRNRDAITESDYREWPAFREFRTSKEFQEAFSQVFGKPFIPEVPPQTQLPTSGVQLASTSRTANGLSSESIDAVGDTDGK